MVPNKYCNILAIDDNQDNLITVKALIKEAFPNANTYTALNGPDGIEIATSIDPDVILLDIDMPVMNGLEFLEQLKKQTTLSGRAKVFMLSSSCSDHSKVTSLQYPFVKGFFEKPLKDNHVQQILSLFQ